VSSPEHAGSQDAGGEAFTTYGFLGTEDLNAYVSWLHAEQIPYLFSVNHRFYQVTPHSRRPACYSMALACHAYVH